MADRETIEVTVGPQGRLVVPAPLRRRLGIEAGDVLVARAKGGSSCARAPGRDSGAGTQPLRAHSPGRQSRRRAHSAPARRIGARERRVREARGWVVDASALLALLHAEPGAETVEEALENGAISTVNWSEVPATLARQRYRRRRSTWRRGDVEALGLEIVPFTVEDAEQAAALWGPTRQVGLSLGDRACLGLARRLGLPALTADRAWLELDLGVQVQTIR